MKNVQIIENQSVEQITNLMNNPQVTHLVLQGKINPDVISKISEMLKDNTTITEINIGYGVQDFTSITEALYNNKGVKKFVSNSTTAGDPISNIAKALKHNNTLKALSLKNNAIKDEDARKISEALKCNTSLETLDLSNNKITQEGIIEIAQNLRYNNSLESLRLEFNGIDSGENNVITQIA
jgi:hypothetical protein